MPTDGPDPRRRLAELMDDRRIELDLSWEEVARRAGMTGMTLRRIRNNETELPRRTQRKLDRALEWQPGSVEGILTGGEPTPIQMDEPPVDPRKEELRTAFRLYRDENGSDAALQWLREQVAAENELRRQGVKISDLT